MKTKKDVLHLYLGCDVMVSDQMGEDVTGKLVCIDLEGMCQISVSPTQIELSVIDHVKPILRPLSELNENSGLLSDFKKMMSGNKGLNLLPDIRAGSLINYFVNSEDPKIILWFLKNHFDIWGLIESEQALKKLK
jgi:hypothetical protein